MTLPPRPVFAFAFAALLIAATAAPAGAAPGDPAIIAARAKIFGPAHVPWCSTRGTDAGPSRTIAMIEPQGADK
jgi:hypothetical protein